MTARPHGQIAMIVAEAGGTLIGNTRLQKATYLLQAAGIGFDFKFSYYLHGPYSDGVSTATNDAVALGMVRREVKPTAWGGKYFVYSGGTSPSPDPRRQALLRHIADATTIAVELAVTALYLAIEHENDDPWSDVAELKSDIASPENITKAKELYNRLAAVPDLPKPLPRLN